MKVLILVCILATSFAAGEETCLEEADGGMCRGYFPMFYYDQKTQSCKEFIYGGCGGNGNRYASEEECLDNCREKKTCLEKPDGGMCRGSFPMFYYDHETQSCKEFIYGGCGGNGNRYASEEACLDNCRDTVVWESEAVCELPAETGMCRGFFPRFYFDKATGRCQRFVYGGCGGNDNNFKSVDECEQQCGKQSAPHACQEEKVVGPCKAAFTRYFFNKETGKCEKFIYGGCQGNSNNFNTEEECAAVCAESAPSACEEEMEVGPCRAAFPRYYFNKQTGKCEKFIYGGCRGNSNNFHTEKECTAVCAA